MSVTKSVTSTFVSPAAKTQKWSLIPQAFRTLVTTSMLAELKIQKYP